MPTRLFFAVFKHPGSAAYTCGQRPAAPHMQLNDLWAGLWADMCTPEVSFSVLLTVRGYAPHALCCMPLQPYPLPD